MMCVTVLITTVPLALIGAAMAWLISYDELARHHAGRREPALEASRRALTVRAFFVALGAIVGVVLSAAHA
jgi:hypothetical protein